MPELLRSIAARLREIVSNRRYETRHKIHLEVSLALNVSRPDAKMRAVGAAERAERLAGYTYDISETGMGVVVPAIRIGGQYLTGQDRTLQIILNLPTGPVEIYATPTRYSPFDESRSATGYLIGVHIKQMSDTDRTRFRAYLKALTKG